MLVWQECDLVFGSVLVKRIPLSIMLETNKRKLRVFQTWWCGSLLPDSRRGFATCCFVVMDKLPDVSETDFCFRNNIVLVENFSIVFSESDAE